MYQNNQHNIQNSIQIKKHFEDVFNKMTDKADRIYHAVFLLTGYVTHKNMTDRLQYLAIDFLEMSYMVHPRESEHHMHVAGELSYILKELKALTQGTVIQGILSPESKQVFDREVDTFLKILMEYVADYKDFSSREHGVVSPLFDDQFFGEALSFLPLTQSHHQHTIGQKMTDKEQFKMTDKKNTTQSIGQKNPTPKKMTSENLSDKNEFDQKNSDQKNDRKKSIINFIKDNTRSHIQSSLKDILNHIGNCSEKTIQRELNDLIRGGYLRKEGDRRWSRYFFLKDM